uniref:Mitochondrial ribosomal protein L32 n=1 Tax=Bos taurus TaxID=9913 RepID=A0AAA9SK14_BOVIN
MAPTMLVLLVPPFPVARGLLRNCWKQLQGKLLQSRPGFSSPPWGPALAVQGPAIFSEPTNDTSGSTETSSLLDSIFWMAAPKNRRSIEVNRCRRRNPHKLIKVKEPRMLQVGPDRMMASQWTPKTHICPVSCLLSPEISIHLNHNKTSYIQVCFLSVVSIKAMVFPVVMYGCESWTVKKAVAAGTPKSLLQHRNWKA